jgi:hypothetical protein
MYQNTKLDNEHKKTIIVRPSIIMTQRLLLA